MKLGIQFGLKAKIGKETRKTQKEKQVAKAESWMCYKETVDYSRLQEHQEEKLWSGQAMRGIKMKLQFCSLCGQCEKGHGFEVFPHGYTFRKNSTTRLGYCYPESTISKQKDCTNSGNLSPQFVPSRELFPCFVLTNHIFKNILPNVWFCSRFPFFPTYNHINSLSW